MTFRPNDFLKTIVSSFPPSPTIFTPIFYSFHYFITRRDLVFQEWKFKATQLELAPSQPPPPTHTFYVALPSLSYTFSQAQLNNRLQELKKNTRNLSTNMRGGGTQPQMVLA